MNAMNAALNVPAGRRLPPYHRRPSLSSSPISFRITAPPLRRLSFSPLTIKASTQNPSPDDNNPHKSQINGQKLTTPIQILKATLLTAAAAAALLLIQSHFPSRPFIPAAPISPPPASESDWTPERLQEIEDLKSSMELKLRSKNIPEAIQILDKLTELQPEEVNWAIYKAHLYAYGEEVELAEDGEPLKKIDPLIVQVHQMLAYAGENVSELMKLEKMAEDGLKLCREENVDRSEIRPVMLLSALIKFFTGRHDEASKILEEMVGEEEGDGSEDEFKFMPYLCLGIIYTSLRRRREAEKNFNMYRRLVPKSENPYAISNF